MLWSQNDIKQLFSARDYSNGLQYVRQGRVRDLVSHGTEEICDVTCKVHGTRVYDVAFRLREERVGVRCTCPRYAERHICKHIAAAMIACSQQHNHPAQKYEETHSVVHAYLAQLAMRAGQTGRVHLVPAFHWTDDGYPAWSFRIGIDRLYIVQNISGFVQNMRNGQTVTYGKELTLSHTLEQFDPLSQSLIRILLDQIAMPSSNPALAYGMGTVKKSVVLRGYAFERWFKVLQGTQVELEGTREMVLFEEGRPDLSFTLHRKGKTVLLCQDQETDWKWFGDINGLYALGKGKLLHCDPDFQQQVAPFLVKRQSVELDLSDFSIFCSYVVPEMRDGYWYR